MGGDTDYNVLLSHDEIQHIIKAHLKLSDFQLVSYTLKAASEKPMGFLGVHIKIVAEIKIGQKSQNAYYFIKKIPVDVPCHHSYAINTGAFYKEIEMYKTVLNDYQTAKKPTRKWCPEFYYSRECEVFVTEDLSEKGFFVFPERQLMPLNYILETVKSMAVMHASALIFEEKLKLGKASTLSKHYVSGGAVTMDVLYPNLMFESEVSDDPTHVGYTFYQAGFKSQLPVVDLLPGYSDEQRKTIKEKLPDVLRLILQLVKPSKKYRNILLHGDLWANNMMFRCDKNGDVTDAVFFDFQLARFAPPAHDLRMFIHLVQTREFRQTHEKQILDVYYSVLTEELRREDFNIEEVYPRKEFEDSYNELYEYGLLTQVLYYQFCLSPPHITSKFLASPELFEMNFLKDRTEMIVETFLTDELCRTRITESMNEIIQHFQLA